MNQSSMGIRVKDRLDEERMDGQVKVMLDETRTD